jgi:CMP-N,N'-diacetyllegionaminic acid synthase
VKDKNIKLLGGKPLIYYTLREALKAETLDKIIFSTDSDKYLEIAYNNVWEIEPLLDLPMYKFYTPRSKFSHSRRPKELAEDVDTTLVLKDIVKDRDDVEWVVCLQPTSPFRTAEDIDNCVKMAKENPKYSVISVCKASQYPEWLITKFKMIEGLFTWNQPAPYGEKLVSQNLPEYYYPNGAIYVTHKREFRENRMFSPTFQGYMMPQWKSIDLEEEIDFVITEAIMKWKKFS